MGYDVYYDGALTVSPPLNKADAVLVRQLVNLERTDETTPIFEAFLSQPERNLPYFGGLLTVSEDHQWLLPEEDDSRHGLSLWIELLIECFFGPRGYLLSGEVSWEGEDRDDAGTIFVHENALECVNDLIFNAGPSWAPRHFVDEHLREDLRKLVDSADSTGCSPDLSVVASEPVERLRSVLTRM